MFKFVLNCKNSVNAEGKMREIENKYDIKFPTVLKNYYEKYDSDEIILCKFSKQGVQLEVAQIVALSDDILTFEKIVDNDRTDGFIPNTMYPLARDRGGNYYYWDCNTENVYLYLCDDVENPIKISDNISEFFEILNNNCDK